MECNIGKIDKTFRIVLGVFLILAGLRLNTWLGAIGVIPIVTALFCKCPLYSVFGISTCKDK
ncbi:YgaP family membrane protein [Candidatus Thioglobus autotrophicus]|uniref:YgaP family membrane protein n=1 Tax=Candidatus Thioglobus autotrophicus TaxID=1705394 RepID=UPI0009E6AA25|nr:DUF2892 domain-containing protein [Candidatus Thioglobus autotrophicus]